MAAAFESVVLSVVHDATFGLVLALYALSERARWLPIGQALTLCARDEHPGALTVGRVGRVIPKSKLVDVPAKALADVME